MLRVVTAAWVLCSAALGCVGDPPAAKMTERQRASLRRYVADSPPVPLHQVSFDFAGKVRLVGYRVSPASERLKSGAQAELTLVWQPIAKLDAGWRVFTHLTDESGKMVLNLDHAGALRAMPGVTGTPFPPDQWPLGKTILDTLKFKLPPHTPDTIVVTAGLFHGRQRLAATSPDGGPFEVVEIARLRVQTQRPVKELDVPRRSGSVVIDGALDEPAWQGAARTGPFVNVSTGRVDRRHPIGGQARLLWDDEFMYVGFEVTDQRVCGGFPADAVDPHLWEKDTVEIMADPDGDGDNRDYYEIQINPQNLVFDSQFDRYNQPRGGPSGPFGHQRWSAELTSAVQVDGTMDDDGDRDRGYTVEAKIPWKSFSKARRHPPRPGDRWRMNFYAMQNNGGVAWSPILGQGNFHRASRFGRVRWTK